MLKKEILDTLEQTGIVLSFLIIMPIVFIVNQTRFSEDQLLFSWYIDWGLTILIPCLILYLSYMLFANESSSEATEYLKSLPIIKWKLLAVKILPRFVTILIVILIYEQIFSSSLIYTFLSSRWAFSGSTFRMIVAILHSTSLIAIPLFSGFMLGITDKKNPLLYIVLLIPVAYLFYCGMFQTFRQFMWIFYKLWQPQNHTVRNIYFGTIVILDLFIYSVILPIIAMVPVFRSWDCSSGKMRSQRLIKRMLVPSGLILLLFILEQF